VKATRWRTARSGGSSLRPSGAQEGGFGTGKTAGGGGEGVVAPFLKAGRGEDAPTFGVVGAGGGFGLTERKEREVGEGKRRHAGPACQRLKGGGSGAAAAGRLGWAAAQEEKHGGRAGQRENG
jgi:hypothetical protein